MRRLELDFRAADGLMTGSRSGKLHGSLLQVVEGEEFVLDISWREGTDSRSFARRSLRACDQFGGGDGPPSPGEARPRARDLYYEGRMYYGWCFTLDLVMWALHSSNICTRQIPNKYYSSSIRTSLRKIYQAGRYITEG